MMNEKQKEYQNRSKTKSALDKFTLFYEHTGDSRRLLVGNQREFKMPTRSVASRH
ncbi:MAG TPA: hypothetical protein VNX65_03920 [Patescibacteria group bacterium]|nr:hypothetical protein [Patescibacteria group bacterium]